MSMLYYSNVERRNFGDLLSHDNVRHLNIQKTPEYDILRSSSNDAITAVWSRDPQEDAQLPNLLICADGMESNWAAWITTFAARIRPFSAYMRLLNESDFRTETREIQMPSLGPLVWPIAGLILGEVLAASRLSDKALETLSATACASTLSFAMFRGAATSPRINRWPDLVAAWDLVRQSTGQRTRPIEGISVARVCATIAEAGRLQPVDGFLTRGDSSVVEACHELIFSPERVPLALSRLPSFGQMEEVLRGSREDRVVAFEKFLSRVGGESGKESELVSFVIGYLASRIAPGTIRHSSMLGSVVQRYPTAMLWYGFCAGTGDGEGRRVIDLPASARRVVRELLRSESVLDAPNCDIGFLEFLALSRTGGNPLEGIITTTPGAAIVELVPRVSMVINISSKPFIESTVGVSRERHIISSMGKQIERLHETYRDLLRGERLPEEQQPSLFSSRRKKR